MASSAASVPAAVAVHPHSHSNNHDNDLDNSSNSHYENLGGSRNSSSSSSNNSCSCRVILHLDLDAFYVACERELNPVQLRAPQPVAVSQYNPYGSLEPMAARDYRRRLVKRAPPPPPPKTRSNKTQQQQQQHPSAVVTRQQQDHADTATSTAGAASDDNGDHNSPTDADNTNGSLIAVSYEARAAGVKRNDRAWQAFAKCPQLAIVVVPVKHGKSDISMYRAASKKVLTVLTNAILGEQQGQQQRGDDDATSRGSRNNDKKDTIVVEVASIDEVYVDVTALVDKMVHNLMLTNEAKHASCGKERMGVMEEAASCTTICGLEVLDNTARAANALDKNEVRRGSHLQVMLDSNSNKNQQENNATTTVVTTDEGSLAWWNRPKDEWMACIVDLRLACGALLAARARKAVVQAFDGIYTLSAGISTNKTMAKLASSLKKPNRQTLINPQNVQALQTLFYPLPLSRIRGLGGKFGRAVQEALGVETVGQLSQVPLTTLLQYCGSAARHEHDCSSSKLQLDQRTARFLHDIARGICREPVTPRTKPKSIASSKNFRGKLAIDYSANYSTLVKWVGELSSELTERLQADGDEYNRRASTLVVAVVLVVAYDDKSKTTSRQQDTGSSPTTLSSSKQCRAPRKLKLYGEVAMRLIQQLVEATKVRLPVRKVVITCISISATHFVDQAAGSASIMAAFERGNIKSSSSNSSSSENHAVRGTTKSLPPVLSSQGRSPPMQSRKARSSVLKKWLVSSDSSEATADKKRSFGVTAEGDHPVKRPKQNPSTIRLPTMNEIDPEVLKELPEELRESLIEEIGRAHPNKEAKGIQKFFRRNCD